MSGVERFMFGFLVQSGGDRVKNEKDILSTILRQAGETVHEPNRFALGVSRFRPRRLDLAFSIERLLFGLRGWVLGTPTP